jgi:hypothetical protein
MNCRVEEIVQTTVRLLAALKAIPWGDTSVSSIESGRTILALANVSDVRINRESVDTTDMDAVRNLEFAKRSCTVLVKGQVSSVSVSALRHELLRLHPKFLQV